MFSAFSRSFSVVFPDGIYLICEEKPLMHKRFFGMLKIAKDRGIPVSTISIGSAFSQSVTRDEMPRIMAEV